MPYRACIRVRPRQEGEPMAFGHSATTQDAALLATLAPASAGAKARDRHEVPADAPSGGATLTRPLINMIG